MVVFTNESGLAAQSVSGRPRGLRCSPLGQVGSVRFRLHRLAASGPEGQF